MTRKILVGLKLSFSAVFVYIFIKNISDFQSLYFKFSLIDVISKNGLAKLFYFIVALQLLLATGIFFIRNKVFKLFFEFAFLVYTAFEIAYLIYMNNFYESCIECSYGLQYFHESFLWTISISLLLCGTYFLIMLLDKNKLSQGTQLKKR